VGERSEAGRATEAVIGVILAIAALIGLMAGAAFYLGLLVFLWTIRGLMLAIAWTLRRVAA